MKDMQMISCMLTITPPEGSSSFFFFNTAADKIYQETDLLS